MALLMILLCLGTATAHAASPTAEKQPWNLEFGLGMGVGYGSQGLPEEATPRWLFSAQFGHHWPQWYVGMTTRGAFSSKASTRIQTAQTVVEGQISHREIEYGLVARRYLGGRHWYTQIGAGLTYNEANVDDQALYATPTGFFNRFYVDGTWLQAAVGHEFKDTPWFVRLEYTYAFYYEGKAILTEKGINRVIDDQSLVSRPHAQIVTVVLGMANVF